MAQTPTTESPSLTVHDLLNHSPWQLDIALLQAVGAAIVLKTEAGEWLFKTGHDTTAMRSSTEDVVCTGYIGNIVLAHTTEKSAEQYVGTQPDVGLWLPVYSRQPATWTHKGVHRRTTPVSDARLLVP